MIKHTLISAVMALYLVLGTWKGYIALFQQGAEEPRQIFPTMASSLPEPDQQALAEGIVIRNDKMLQQILEDFLS